MVLTTMGSPADSQEPRLALCDLHHPRTHGTTDASSPGVHNHILVLSYIDADTEAMGHALEEQEMVPAPANAPHPSIRAFARVARSPRVFGVQVVRPIRLPGGETVAVVRTGGLRRLQRACRARLYPGAEA